MGAEAECDRIKGPWSPEEDEALRRLVERHGARNWTAIGRGIPGRSGKSCRLRWCNQLSPQVERRPFTAEEDAAILRAHPSSSYPFSGDLVAAMQEMIRAEVCKYMSGVGLPAGCGAGAVGEACIPQLVEGVMRAAAERVGVMTRQ
ncbi:unnamed protein product [Triticum turgidum subsp. durum]|uniref:Uncharacterized protein n=1 Tax=Triticum turgidum subsp. durum TaxID=4567 RepID=A0A9R0YJW5_TRITD|nr:unnamed protein product [Triticum turgidum subsp. durum]